MKSTSTLFSTLNSDLGYEYAIVISEDRCSLDYSDETSGQQTMELASLDEMESVAYEMLRCVSAYRKLRHAGQLRYE
jgi:hypothetical protein